MVAPFRDSKLPNLQHIHGVVWMNRIDDDRGIPAQTQIIFGRAAFMHERSKSKDRALHEKGIHPGA
jgi:hypothetical protein